MKIIIKSVFFISLTFNLLGQNSSDSTAKYHFSKIFDPSISDSVFWNHYQQFYQKAYKHVDSSKQWHRGQTDYAETFYSSGFHNFNSTTYFNSMRHTMYVQQLCLDYKVIHKTQSGGDYIHQGEVFELPIEPLQNRSSFPDSVWTPVTLYNHELQKILHFESCTVYQKPIKQPFQGKHLVTEIIFGGIRGRRLEPMTSENTPVIFIENH